MSTFKFTNPTNGQPFEIKGSANLTETQAREIFNKQLQAGSLVGLKSGNSLNAAKQAAGGLAGAVSQVAQAGAGFGGGALGALQGALKNVPGTQSLSSAPLSVASALPTSIDAGKSLEQKSLSGITSAIAKTNVGDTINLANFSKQAPALGSLGSISVPGVTATLAQISKSTGQGPSQITSALGAGKFGLDANQLQSAGLLKPGVAQNFLSNGTNTLTSVLKSPAVWTGKDGINSLSSFLGSSAAQDKAQQGLMAQGLSAVKSVGIPTDKLSPSSLAAVATNAAKSPADTVKWATGGVGLAAGAIASLNSAARNASFAVNFSDEKVPQEWKEQTVPEPAADTVNRETLNAATTRVVGNEKVPPVDYNNQPAPINIVDYQKKVNELRLKSTTLFLQAYKDLQAITQGYKKGDAIPAAVWQRGIDRAEQLVADTETVAADALTLLRQANYVTSRGLGLFLKSDIERFKTELQEIRDEALKDVVNRKKIVEDFKQQLATAVA